MTDALEGPRRTGPTLREQANSPRIGRARFIGNAVGVIVLFVLIEVALTVAGLKQTIQFRKEGLYAGGEVQLVLPNLWGLAIGGVVLLLCLLDLAVRRRRDRGQSGADAAAILILLGVLGAGCALGLLASVPTILIVAIGGLAGLYLLVMLAIMPGTKGPNRYGPDPRLP